MRVLIVGKDSTLFDTGPGVPSDGRARHQLYADLLRQRYGAQASMRVIAYTTRSSASRVEQLSNDLILYPTRSVHRALFLADVLRVLPRVLRNWRPDVITSQNPWEEGTLCYFLSRLLGARYLPQLHVDLFSGSWRNEKFSNRLRYLAARAVLRRADGVRVVSPTLRDDLESRFGVSRDRISVVPVGVDFAPQEPTEENRDRFKRRLSRSLESRPVVLFVGFFYEPKNLPLWIDVAAKVLQKSPETQFVLAGDGPCRTGIETRVHDRGLASSFHFLGRVGREELPLVYAAADVFLLSSSHESFGRVLIEAFLSGVPVVATRCGGPKDTIRHGVNGLLRSCGDRDGLAESVLELLNNSDLRHSMGRSGREHTAKKYSLVTLASSLIDCWGALGSES